MWFSTEVEIVVMFAGISAGVFLDLHACVKERPLKRARTSKGQKASSTLAIPGHISRVAPARSDASIALFWL